MSSFPGGTGVVLIFFIPIPPSIYLIGGTTVGHSVSDIACSIMTPTKLKKLKRQLEEMSRSPQNRNYKDLVSLALQLGRQKEKRGKEVNYTRKRDPALSPPLSIPQHPGDLKPRTALSIIEALLSDVDGWEIYLSECADKERR